MKLIWLLSFFLMQSVSFKETQLRNVRVKNAYDEKEIVVNTFFKEKGIKRDGFTLFLRVFKKEQKIEVWVKAKESPTYVLLHEYNFCSTSGTLGPKRKEGDLQIPEGIYHINHFNPVSNFHLSLGINYPNASDKILSDQQHPGGAIYIHGNCVTIGCMPITDDKIKELYILAVEAKNNGQQKIPVHIFPSRLDNQAWESLKKEYNQSPQTIQFWENLKPIYQDFEDRKTLRTVKVRSSGAYYF
jgi:murein L,D-transpeptidase YafK